LPPLPCPQLLVISHSFLCCSWILARAELQRSRCSTCGPTKHVIPEHETRTAPLHVACIRQRPLAFQSSKRGLAWFMCTHAFTHSHTHAQIPFHIRSRLVYFWPCHWAYHSMSRLMDFSCSADYFRQCWAHPWIVSAICGISALTLSLIRFWKNLIASSSDKFNWKRSST